MAFIAGLISLIPDQRAVAPEHYTIGRDDVQATWPRQASVWDTRETVSTLCGICLANVEPAGPASTSHLSPAADRLVGRRLRVIGL